MTRAAAAHILITGRVQGVGYRFFVQAAAETRGLRGWVQNMTNGAVECEVEGPRSSIDDLVRELGKGPTLACVEAVQVTWRSPANQFSNFTIRA